MIQFSVNGKERSVEVSPDTPLITFGLSAALFAASGARVRSLPLARNKVQAARRKA